MLSRIPLSKIFYKFGSNIVGSFSYCYGLNYLLAAALTYLIVWSGLDWAWFRFSFGHPVIFYAGFVPVALGMFLPFLVPLWLYVSGRIGKKISRQITGLAIGQAAILGFGISTFIKLFTGRIPPLNAAALANNSSGFQFGFYRGGWFNGWPSSHTTVAFAVAMTLIGIYPNNKTVKICSWIFALGIGLGVSLNIHWLSDAVAGALIGYAIGKTVGSGFRKLKQKVLT
jgi:membrane-associated phospholipid phosphatase